MGRQPDTWVGVLNELPNTVKPWLPNLGGTTLSGQLNAAENYLDKQELRSVVLVGHGSGASVALMLAAQQPQRVTALVLSSPVLQPNPEHIRRVTKALRFVPAFLLRRRGLDKRETIEQLIDVSTHDLSAAAKNIQAPTLVLSDDDEVAELVPSAQLRTIHGSTGTWYELDPVRFVSEISAVF